MCAIASLEIVIRPSGDESACPASTYVLTGGGCSGLRNEQLGPLVRPRDPRLREPCFERQPRELLVRIEVPARRERIRRGRGSLRLRCGGEDRQAAALR